MTFAWDGRSGSLAAALVLPTVLVGLMVAAGFALGWKLVLSVLMSPCPLLMVAMVGFGLWKALQIPSVVVLEDAHLRVPASGTRAVYAFLDEGYQYSWKKRVLTVRVPYERITGVRRVTRLPEKQRIGLRGRHFTTSVKFGATYQSITVRGQYPIVGSGAVEGAARLIAHELDTCWVMNPDNAVAIEIDRVPHASTVWPSFPDELRDVTLYVSCTQPDELVEELIRRMGR